MWKTHAINNKYKGERPKTFFLRSGTRQGCSLLPLLVNIGLEVLSEKLGKKKK